jgi:hypothetical protein
MVEMTKRAIACELPEEPRASHGEKDNKEEEERDVCWICRNRDDDDQPLCYLFLFIRCIVGFFIKNWTSK